MSLPRVLLVVTGGTITMTQGAGPGIAPTLTGEDLARAVPALADHAQLEVQTYAQKPGASLTVPDLVAIAALIDQAAARGFAGAVVVQGTDTIEETAFVLDLLVSCSQPVIVTGAMRGPQAPGADGPANLLASVIAASSATLSGSGCSVVLNDEVHAARFVQKSHTVSTAAFTSPDIGPVARVIEGRVHAYAQVRRQAVLPRPEGELDQPVALITAGLGSDGRLLPALPALGFKAVVIEAMGAGHLPVSWVPEVEALAKRMPVVLASRVPAGPVLQKTYGFPGSEMDLIARGAIPAAYLSGPKACLLLRLLLASKLSGDALREAVHRCARRDA